MKMNPKSNDKQGRKRTVRKLASNAREVIKEPILQKLLSGSVLSEAQLETLLIDLIVEDAVGSHITYEDKASYRQRKGSRARGVSRGAFNRTLKQARRNVTRSLYTMLLLTYLGFFELNIFRPFEEVASRIGDYRAIREVLSGKSEITSEDLESIRVTEESIESALEELSSSLSLKTEVARRRE
jgi:hypothetical protein